MGIIGYYEKKLFRPNQLQERDAGGAAAVLRQRTNHVAAEERQRRNVVHILHLLD